MEEKELTTLLRSHDLKISSRMWRCPDENQLTAYVTGQALDRQKLERHLSDCKPCLQTIALLIREFDESESVPPALLVRARSLADNARTGKWNWGWAVATASACLLIVASIFLWQLWSAKTPRSTTELVAKKIEPPLSKAIPVNANTSQPVQPTRVEKPKVKESQTPVVRGVEVGPKVNVIFPREGSTVRLTVQTLRWLPVADATFYEVKLVTPDGASVTAQSTNDTELLLPANTLKPGSTYYVTVVAHLGGNRTVRSAPVKFRVAEAR
jgi:hypothetical protein